MTDQPLEICILAAGMSTRMRSSIPKVMHPLAGKPLLAYILETAQCLNPAKIHVVVGPVGNTVMEKFPCASVNWVTQLERRGTGHAVQQVLPALGANSNLLILAGDVPLISSGTLRAMISEDSMFTLLSVRMEDPTGYGRIIRSQSGLVVAIVEERDATEEQKRIDEINTGVMAVNVGWLAQWLPRLTDNNAQKELLLTDIVALANNDNVPVKALLSHDPLEVTGVNTMHQLEALERALQLRIRERSQ